MKLNEFNFYFFYNINKMNSKFLQKALLILLLSNLYYCQNSCKSNFECNTLCCIDNKCAAEASECENINRKIYIGISIVALVFLLAAIIYLFISLSEIRKNVEKMQIEMAEKEEKNTKFINEQKEKNQSEPSNKE